ncbi:M-phase inducer phosphatase 3 isoform X3 [Heteronotia binoei]|uniref:M-phase inducer phosphatase 3 isoform X3 n=1 Tax=Heteronotia binoei TaxID=13085 RepID=UPI00293183F1|nr:M-phase inducer phosphatase 3 isoform X3 [Heteronotia binoei]
MSTNFSPMDTDVPRLRFQFQSGCQFLLNLLRDTEIALPFNAESPLTPDSSLTQGFRNVSGLAGDTPRRCLELSNLSNGGEETAFNFSQSPRTLEAAQKDSAEPQDNLRDSWRQCANLLETEVLCSTPGTPGCIHRINWEINSPPMNKENKPLAGHLSSMAVLFSEPLLSQDINVSEVSVNKIRLFRSPSLPEKLNRPVLKQTVKNHGDETPMKVKQKHSPVQEQLDGIVLLKKTASFSDIEIVRVLDQDFGRRQLIGDLSNVFALPTVMGKHQDLRYITSQTMAALLHDQFQSLIEKFCIIDCRYPYEYHGGHIKGAFNIHRQDDLFEHFLKKPLLTSAPQKRLILVFYCEFSSERSPKMCRYLREEDRTMNEYPALHYPELYVLQGGYKDFFLEYKEMCEPQSYCPMHHQDFKTEMLKFRVKSKTRAGGRKRRDQIAHLMKL